MFEDNDGNTLLKSPGKLINPTTVRAPYIGLPIPALRNPFIVSVVNDEDELLTETKEFNFPAHLIPPETEAEVPLPSSSFTPSQPTTVSENFYVTVCVFCHYWKDNSADTENSSQSFLYH